MDPSVVPSAGSAHALPPGVRTADGSDAPGVPRTAAESVLDSLLRTASAGPARADFELPAFLAEPSPLKAIAYWVDRSRGGRPMTTKRQVEQLLSRDVARLDDLISRQVNAVLHHPEFQKLEASWRGLRYLVDQAGEAENIKVRVLDLSWKELTRDLERALEFDQSQLFRKVYGEEFGTPGGEPYGVLIGDYEVHLRPGPGHPTDDLAVLGMVSQVAAAAFAPFLTAAHPDLLDLGSFTELEKPLNLARIFEQRDYLKWRAFRGTEDARFVGLVLPRVLMRLPYADGAGHVGGFRFHEDVGAPDRSQYLWGNAAYAFAAVLVRAFADCGWLSDIRGVRPGVRGQGLVTGLPVHSFATDKHGVAPKSSTDAHLSPQREKELAELGFIPLCHCPDTELSAFYSNQSVQKPKTYDEPAATANARLSAMLQYMLCTSRFAHYLKVIARDKVGGLAGPGECEALLNRWLMNYITTNDNDDADTKARFPLREARVQVREQPGKPGSYQCVIHLRPHFQLDQVLTTVRLTTELAPGQRR
jgi:type VI secretion system ImpC/EvpB family protein